jgi:lipopolysaccharide export system protein LptA
MASWQRRARLLIAVSAAIFAIVVAFMLSRRAPGAAGALVRMADKAVMESRSGDYVRRTGSREDLRIEFEKELTYADGSSTLVNVTVTSTNRADGRVFTVTGKVGKKQDNPESYVLNGDVKLVASDGLTAKTEHASYAASDGTVRAPGPVEFSKGRMSGRGMGMTYDKEHDVMTILAQAAVHIGADATGAGGADVASGTAAFARRDKNVKFDGGVKVQRSSGEITEADQAVAYLSDDEKRIQVVELRGHSRVTTSKPTVGGLQELSGRDINLNYGPDGQVIQHVLVVSDSVLQLAGETGKPGRQLRAVSIDTTLAPDGSTPTALAARDAVQLTFPAEPGVAARSIHAATMDAIGEPGRGLTKAHFERDVEYRETSPTVDRAARSAALDVGLKPGLSSIDEATFTGNVRFTDGTMRAVAAASRYVLDKGLLELRGTEPPPGAVVPHVVNEQIAIDATSIDVTLQGPRMTAAGNVKSVLQPAKKGTASDTKMPSLLKQDQPVNVTAANLQYDGEGSKATYTGGAQLWQADTAISGDTVVINDKTGDLAANGKVATAVTMDEVKKDKAASQTTKSRVQSLGTAADFDYRENTRCATYTGGAHLKGPEGDMKAEKIELYLKPSGNELERAEAYENVVLKETARTTTGSRVSYFADDERYFAKGTPVKVIDECDFETAGRTLTFHKATDTIVVDGQKTFRTSGKGSGKCPGS